MASREGAGGCLLSLPVGRWRSLLLFFALDAIMNPDIKLVTVQGVAGTGKTLLSLAGALEQRRNYHQIF